MKKDDAVIRSFGDRILHSSKIKTLCGVPEVRVGTDGNRHIGENLVVVGPGWVAEVDLGMAGVEFGEEESTQMHCSSTRDGLDGACALLSNGWRISAQNQLCSGGCEGAEAGNGEVFVVQGGVPAEDLLCLKLWVSIDLNNCTG